MCVEVVCSCIDEADAVLMGGGLGSTGAGDTFLDAAGDLPTEISLSVISALLV